MKIAWTQRISKQQSTSLGWSGSPMHQCMFRPFTHTQPKNYHHLHAWVAPEMHTRNRLAHILPSYTFLRDNKPMPLFNKDRIVVPRLDTPKLLQSGPSKQMHPGDSIKNVKRASLRKMYGHMHACMDAYQYKLKLGTRHKTLWAQEIHCMRFDSLFPIQHVVLGHIECSSFPQPRYVHETFCIPLASTHLSSHMSIRPFFARMSPTTEQLHKLELWRIPG